MGKSAYEQPPVKIAKAGLRIAASLLMDALANRPRSEEKLELTRYIKGVLCANRDGAKPPFRRGDLVQSDEYTGIVRRMYYRGNGIWEIGFADHQFRLARGFNLISSRTTSGFTTTMRLARATQFLGRLYELECSRGTKVSCRAGRGTGNVKLDITFAGTVYKDLFLRSLVDGLLQGFQGHFPKS